MAGLLGITSLTHCFATVEDSATELSLEVIASINERLNEKGIFLKKMKVNPGFSSVGNKLMNIYFPIGSLVTLIERKGEFLIPRGNTEILDGDNIFILCREDNLSEVQKMFKSENDKQ